MANIQSKVASLEERVSKLIAENNEIRKKYSEIEAKKTELEVENVKLRQAIEENTKRDARVEELEQKNIELENRLAILEQGKKEKSISTEDISHSPVNSNDTHEQIVHNEESNISSHEVTGNSDMYQESVTPTPPIPAETISMEEKKEN